MRLKNATVGEWKKPPERAGHDAHAIREKAIATIADRQHGVVTTRQLLALGFSERAISRRAEAGRLHRIRRGVYAVGHCALTAASRRLAAVLACGDRALASHKLAAAIWDLRPDHSSVYHVTAAAGARSHGDIRVHRPSDLADDDFARRDGIPVTSLARTLVDLGDVVPADHVRAAFVRAEQLRLIDMTAIARTLDRASRRRGPALLHEVVRAYDPRWQATRSWLELRVLDLVAAHGLAEPQVNAWVNRRWMVDFLWQPARVVFEADGAFAHATPGAKRRDALRERGLRHAGFNVLRASFEDVRQRPEDVLAALQASLSNGRRAR